MMRHVVWFAVAGLLFNVPVHAEDASSASETPPRYNLRKLPTWTVGDQVGMAYSERYTRSGGLALGSQQVTLFGALKMSQMGEVISVDDEGNANAVLLKVIKAHADTTVQFAYLPDSGAWSNSIENVYMVLRRDVKKTNDGVVSHLCVDPRTIRIEGDGRMTLPQLCLLRALAIREQIFDIVSENGDQRSMFVDRPVAAGESWKIPERMETVVRGFVYGSLEKTPIDPGKVPVVLKSVSDGEALVEIDSGGIWNDPKYGMINGIFENQWKLDVASGRLMYWKYRFGIGQNAGEVRYSGMLRFLFKASFRAGSGQASVVPDGLTFVGWNPDDVKGKRHHQELYSIIPPKHMATGLQDTDTVSKWDGRNATLRICLQSPEKIQSYDGAVKALKYVVRKQLGSRVELAELKKRFLPTRLPCVFASPINVKEGRAAMAMVAITDMGYYCLVADFPEKNASLRKEMVTAFESFRDK